MFLHRIKEWILVTENPTTIIHAARTAVAAVSAHFVAHWLGLTEAYWATITTLIVMQSSIGATLPLSVQRFAGTAMGAVIGGFVATYFGQNVIAFGVTVFALGVVCALFHFHRNAYRYSSITLAIILLISRSVDPWYVAVNRFIEVSIGIAVAVVITLLWPEERSSKPVAN